MCWYKFKKGKKNTHQVKILYFLNLAYWFNDNSMNLTRMKKDFKTTHSESPLVKAIKFSIVIASIGIVFCLVFLALEP